VFLEIAHYKSHVLTYISKANASPIRISKHEKTDESTRWHLKAGMKHIGCCNKTETYACNNRVFQSSFSCAIIYFFVENSVVELMKLRRLSTAIVLTSIFTVKPRKSSFNLFLLCPV